MGEIFVRLMVNSLLWCVAEIKKFHAILAVFLDTSLRTSRQRECRFLKLKLRRIDAAVDFDARHSFGVCHKPIDHCTAL
jgi:hypothetical protein